MKLLDVDTGEHFEPDWETEQGCEVVEFAFTKLICRALENADWSDATITIPKTYRVPLGQYVIAMQELGWMR